MTVISPGATEAEDTTQAGLLPASAVAEAIAFAIAQPRDVGVNEIVVRPTRQTF